MVAVTLLILLFQGLLAFAPPPVAAQQPADCPTAPAPGPTQTIPLLLNLRGLPGVPAGVSGQMYTEVPAEPPGGMACSSGPPPGPRDILHGETGDLMRGPGASSNLLSGSLQPRVEIGYPPPARGAPTWP
jgi:hypothetical protein